MTASEAQRTSSASPAQSFKDTKGRTWSLELNVVNARRVRERLKVDLLNGEIVTTIRTVFADTILLCDVLFVIADANAAQADRVTDEEFGRSMSGDAIENGGIALMYAIRDFTPNELTRTRVGKLIDSILDAMSAVHDEADRTLDAALARVRADLGAARAELAGGTSSSAPAPDASSAVASPSAS